MAIHGSVFGTGGRIVSREIATPDGLVGSAYIILRIIGRFLGAWSVGILSLAEPFLRRWMGMALMPQAGVALGMVLIASQRFPALGEILLPVVIGATVLFELIGPVLTRLALYRAGDVVVGCAQRQLFWCYTGNTG